jgi:transcriptional regulator NrdR family protein
MICPKCKKDNAHRAERRGFLDNAANRFYYKPYSCTACSHRFYSFRPPYTFYGLRMEAKERIADQFSRKNRKRLLRGLYAYAAALAFIAVMLYMFTRSS